MKNVIIVKILLRYPTKRENIVFVAESTIADVYTGTEIMIAILKNVKNVIEYLIKKIYILLSISTVELFTVLKTVKMTINPVINRVAKNVKKLKILVKFNPLRDFAILAILVT